MPRGSFQQEVYCIIMLDQPLARGRDAVLPYVDVFISDLNFESLQELARAISGAAGQEWWGVSSGWHFAGERKATMTSLVEKRYISDSDGKTVGVIVPIELWREIGSGRETANLLKSE